MKKVVCVITEMPEDEFWLPLSIKSYLFADNIIIIDGSKTPKIEEDVKNKFPEHINKFKVIHSPYPHKDLGADGKQRNIYMNFIKEHCEGWLAIIVDSDEVLADDAKEQLDRIESEMEATGSNVYNPKMEHFINDFNKADATHPFHYCPFRIFIVSKYLSYTEVEHVSLQTCNDYVLNVLQDHTHPVLYYHYGYTKGRETIIKKFRKHMLKSNIHTPEFLTMWKNAHLFGTYPVKTFLGQHPKPVRDYFEF